MMSATCRGAGAELMGGRICSIRRPMLVGENGRGLKVKPVLTLVEFVVMASVVLAALEVVGPALDDAGAD